MKHQKFILWIKDFQFLKKKYFYKLFWFVHVQISSILVPKILKYLYYFGLENFKMGILFQY